MSEFQIVWIIALFSAIIVPHELGHLALAKVFNVKVLKFSLGFGPALIKRKIGETEWALSCFIIGGYVKLLGEDPGEKVEEWEKDRAYYMQPIWKRACIVVVGSLTNVLFAMLVMTFVYAYGFRATTTEIGDVKEGSPAMLAGVKAGDVVTEVAGIKTDRWEKIPPVLNRNVGKVVDMQVKRGVDTLVAKMRVEKQTVMDVVRRRQDIAFVGIKPADRHFVARENIFNAARMGIAKTVDMAILVFVALVQLMRGVISAKELGGPLMIIRTVKEQLSFGLQNYLIVMAFLCVNIGCLNLLPIPSFDGGHLLFMLVEKIRKKPLSFKATLTIQRIGVSLIIVLMTFVVWNDLQKIAGK
jgi:regulator of sigma E protease